MNSNTSLKALADILNKSKSVLIFPHINPDGDALGSAAALCRVLRNSGKEAFILINEDIPRYIDFMDTEFCTRNRDCIERPDVCICVDCSEYGRIPGLSDKFESGSTKLCIDHHKSLAGFADYYYIDESEAATAMIIYKLIAFLDGEMDKSAAESLYTGIITDTGGFQYSNVTAQTHEVAAELLKMGVDHLKINVRLYQTIPRNKLKLQAEIIDNIEFVADGNVAIAYVSEEMLQKHSTAVEDADGAIDLIRNIEGVEIAAILKEKKGAIKVSFRAKSFADVRIAAAAFGGGGHVKAAGCTLEMSMEDALVAVKKELLHQWEKQLNERRNTDLK